MKTLLALVWFAVTATAPQTAQAGQTGHGEFDALVAVHAKANSVPEALVHRIILRESRYQPRLLGRGGCIGLMQIKLATARSLGYGGDAEGLRDANTNLTYGVKYLAGAYRAAKGDHDRAMQLYASGYYEIAKRQRLETATGLKLDASGNQQPPIGTSVPDEIAESPANAAPRHQETNDR
ncbi:transglycosylase SLT domain-containing protein [Bradyrhizobium sp.]|uniref:transglycosylase SLT domain-containing protein n=1 Tax=Bradyrhizobium sp. TaxID=376 RepID=UPI003C32D321